MHDYTEHEFKVAVYMHDCMRLGMRWSIYSLYCRSWREILGMPEEKRSKKKKKMKEDEQESTDNDGIQEALKLWV